MKTKKEVAESTKEVAESTRSLRSPQAPRFPQVCFLRRSLSVKRKLFLDLQTFDVAGWLGLVIFVKTLGFWGEFVRLYDVKEWFLNAFL